MNIISTHYYSSPVGELLIGSYQDQLCLCDWKYRKMRSSIDKRIQSHLDADFKEEMTPVIEQTIKELNEYFTDDRTEFSIPLLFCGSEFQKVVWQKLLDIPFGETTTYKKLSQDMNQEKAIRAIASANGANAISIIVPCHRVVGSDGSLVGYAGGLAAKKKLLKLEKSSVVAQLSLFD